MAKKTVNVSTGALKACSILVLIFVLQELLLPVNHVTAMSYDVSNFDYRLLSLLVSVPTVVVWFVAFWGYSRLKSYAKVLGRAPEASGYVRLSLGITWLAWVLPINTIIDKFLSAISVHSPKHHTTLNIISNYFNIILPLVAFIIIFVAAKTLLLSQKWKVEQIKSPLVMAIFLLGGALYCYLILKSASTNSLNSRNNIYGLPVWLIIVSVILPYLYGWFLGLLAAYQLNLFGINMPGVLYRRALLYLTFGLVAIVLTFIVLQYISAIWPHRTHLVFNYQLAITIFIRVIDGIGFIMLAIGANKLKMIEEV